MTLDELERELGVEGQKPAPKRTGQGFKSGGNKKIVYV